MRVFGLVVTKNECERYLQSCLQWHIPILDGVLLYDDQSTDGTAGVAVAAGVAGYTTRPDSVPTFMEHEGKFRQDSLMALEERFSLQTGDWVIVIDTDEFFASDVDERADLMDVVREAERTGCKSVRIPRPELWSLDPALERIDGYWGSIKCTRLFRWEPGGHIQDIPMGCGNEPTYINSAKVYDAKHSLRLFHVGYVHEADREEKYSRYNSLSNNGHNDQHIQSILARPQLRPIYGVPPIWRGLR